MSAEFVNLDAKWLAEFAQPGNVIGEYEQARLLRIAEDITIRIRPRADGSRIDIRSASRIGPHDLGINAARIAAFAEEVELLVESR
ncbi:MAG: DUF1499 domain-containing protein [Hyphomicrobiales bacterium]